MTDLRSNLLSKKMDFHSRWIRYLELAPAWS